MEETSFSDVRGEPRAGSALSLGEIIAIKRAGLDAPPRPMPDLTRIDPRCRMEKASRRLHDTAAQLCILPSQLRQRIRARRLLGFWSDEEKCWKLPSVQFDGPWPLPGIEAVLRSMSSHLQPADVYGFLTTPQPDLEDEDGRAMTPAEWLRAGGAPDAVIGLVDR